MTKHTQHTLTSTRSAAIMAFDHTPASTVTTPDTFVNTDTREAYIVTHDEEAEDPRTWRLDSEVAIHIYRDSRGLHNAEQDIPDNEVSRGFAHFIGIADGDDVLAKDLTRRWLRAYHPKIARKVSFDSFSLTGYVQGDWCRIFIVAQHGFGHLAQHADQFRQWLYGNVWTVSNSVTGDSLGDIYTDDTFSALHEFLRYEADSAEMATELLEFDDLIVNAIAQTLIEDDKHDVVRWINNNHTEMGELVYGPFGFLTTVANRARQENP